MRWEIGWREAAHSPTSCCSQRHSPVNLLPWVLPKFDLSWLPSSSLGDSWLQSSSPPPPLTPQAWLILGAREASGRAKQTAEEVERAAEKLTCSALKSWVKQRFPQASRVLLQLLVSHRTPPPLPGLQLSSGEWQNSLRTQWSPRGLQLCSQQEQPTGAGGGPPALAFVFPPPSATSGGLRV